MEIVKLLRLQWDRTLAVASAIVGLLALFIGYRGVSDTPHVAEQLPYFISGGIFGIFMLGVATVSWLSADMRDEWRVLQRLCVLVEDDGGKPESPVVDGPATVVIGGDPSSPAARPVS